MSQGPRVIAAAATLLLVLLASARNAPAAEDRTFGDLFDVSRGTTVTSSSAVVSSQIEAMFGATSIGPEPEVVFFVDAPDGTVHFVEWSTAAPVTVAGFNLHAAGDIPGTPERRAFDHFRLQAKVGDTFQTLYDEDVAIPYVFLDGKSFLMISSDVATTTAQEFRAEFTQHGEGSFSGPRVFELDGFPEALCGDANYSATITASDALVALKTSVGSAACPLCVCDVNANASTTAADALSVLRESVGTASDLTCAACFLAGSTTTTTVSTTTSLPPTTTSTSTTTSSTTTTTIQVGGDLCEIDAATCTADACSCGQSSGLDYHLGAEGRVSGPVGSEFRVNINAPQGGTIDCGGWTRIFEVDAIGCDDIGCCRREQGQPEIAS